MVLLLIKISLKILKMDLIQMDFVRQKNILNIFLMKYVRTLLSTKIIQNPVKNLFHHQIHLQYFFTLDEVMLLVKKTIIQLHRFHIILKHSKGLMMTLLVLYLQMTQNGVSLKNIFNQIDFYLMRMQRGMNIKVEMVLVEFKILCYHMQICV